MRVLTAALIVPLASQCRDCGGADNGLERVEDASFEIREGDHDSRPGGTREMRTGDFDRFLAFQARFRPDCAYLSADPVNQYDWNKLMGITTVNIHEDSVRLGWRYAPAADAIELGLYAYVDGTRVSQEITSVPLDTWVDVTLELSDATVRVEVDGVEVEVEGRGRGDGLFQDTTWVLRSAYFGGDERAPHDLHIDVRDAWTDR